MYPTHGDDGEPGQRRILAQQVACTFMRLLRYYSCTLSTQVLTGHLADKTDAITPCTGLASILNHALNILAKVYIRKEQAYRNGVTSPTGPGGASGGGVVSNTPRAGVASQGWTGLSNGILAHRDVRPRKATRQSVPYPPCPVTPSVSLGIPWLICHQRVRTGRYQTRGPSLGSVASSGTSWQSLWVWIRIRVDVHTRSC